MASIEDMVAAFREDRDDQHVLLLRLARSTSLDDRRNLVSAV